MLDETGKAAVIHPTGTGKSFIEFKLAEYNADKRICWLSPSEIMYRNGSAGLTNNLMCTRHTLMTLKRVKTLRISNQTTVII